MMMMKAQIGKMKTKVHNFKKERSVWTRIVDNVKIWDVSENEPCDGFYLGPRIKTVMDTMRLPQRGLEVGSKEVNTDYNVIN